MMRLPPFTYRAPESSEEVVQILAGEGPAAQVVAGGTDLFPNMKRRQHLPRTVISLRHVDALKGIEWREDGSVWIGAGETLRALERDERLKQRLPALWDAVVSISTPILRNMGTIGGNLCLDTRCYYLNQNFEWRRAINHCLKCGGDTCWTAPGSEKCWAVNSSDGVPVMIAMGAKFALLGPDGEREVSAAEMYDIGDGREWLTRRPGELMTSIEIPAQKGAKSVYLKLRRREAFDFPVLGVAVRMEKKKGRVEHSAIVLNAVGPAPVRCSAAEIVLKGTKLSDETIHEATLQALRTAKPLDNTDHMPSWRRKMVRVYVRRALEALRAS
ncbi:MAG: FAD binding domain-containing protein [Planctomycetota bacterium]|jgi:4-hydroxybenzoyl-CoA reductase subunit beta